MKMQGHEIVGVKEGSTASEIGLKRGDVILAVNDKPIEDIFDYQFYM